MRSIESYDIMKNNNNGSDHSTTRMFLALLGYVAAALAFEANHAERNQALLRALHGELLESGFDVVMESGFDGAVATEASRFEVSDVNGTRHECVVDAEAERGGDSGGGSGAHPGVVAPLTDPLAGLKGRCVQMNHGYWTYQWCHEHEVLQLHVDESGTTDASHSLGIFKPNAGGAGDSAELVQHFRGGEICPETSAPRRADVRLECCAVANAEDGGAALTVGSLTETSKCVYTIVLCVQALCVGAKPLIPDVLPASALLAPLKNACFQWRPPRVSFYFLYIHAITMTKYSTNLMMYYVKYICRRHGGLSNSASGSTFGSSMPCSRSSPRRRPPVPMPALVLMPAQSQLQREREQERTPPRPSPLSPLCFPSSSSASHPPRVRS